MQPSTAHVQRNISQRSSKSGAHHYSGEYTHRRCPLTQIGCSECCCQSLWALGRCDQQHYHAPFRRLDFLARFGASTKKRRGSRMGMSSLREMLKASNKSHTCSSPVPTDSFVHNKEHHYFPHSTITPISTQQRVRTQPSTDPSRSAQKGIIPTSNVVICGTSANSQIFPASIVLESSLDSASGSSSEQSDKCSMEEEDWDHMSSASHRDPPIDFLEIWESSSRRCLAWTSSTGMRY